MQLPQVSPAAPALLEWLSRHQEDMAGMVADLARLESPSLDPASQEPVFARLALELESTGLRAQRLHGRATGGCLFAVPRKENAGKCAAQLLLGHCDTVWPHGTLATMPVERRGGRLFGPGVFDMKGGLVQAIYALRALRHLGLQPAAVPVVLINSDEEIGTGETRRHILRLTRRVCRVFVLEPALGEQGDLKTRRKGVGQLTVTVRGRASHAGLDPERGASAIRELARVVERLYELADPPRGITINVGVIAGGLRGNVVAPEARAEVDVRVLNPEDVPRVEAAIAALRPSTPGTEIAIAGSIDRPPMLPTKANARLWTAAQLAAAALGIEIGQGTAGGASDGNLTSITTATLDGLGAVGGGAHAVDEHIEVARLPERAALLALLLLAPVAARATDALGEGEEQEAPGVREMPQ